MKYYSYLFLLPIFFTLHGINENYGLVPASVAFRLFIKYLLITTGVLGVCWLLFKRKGKAVFFAFLVLCAFFFFGALHDGLKGIFPSSFITSYTFLLPFLAVLYGILFFLFKRNGGSSEKASKFFTILFLLLTGLETATLLYHMFTKEDRKNNLFVNQTTIVTPFSATVKEKPDIYFIVFDGYTNAQCLKEDFNYNNSAMDSLLRAHHFFISSASQSNYNVTPFSLSSTLGVQYLKPGIENEIITSRVFLQAIETLKHNPMTRFLKEQGYTVKNYGCFDFAGAPAQTIPYFNASAVEQIDNQTLSSRIRRDIWWNVTTRDFFTGGFRVPDSYKKSKQYHLYRNNFNWKSLLGEMKKTSDGPKFVYTHLMLPHEPFYLTAEGKEIPDKAIIQNSINSKRGYLGQLIYANSLLKELIPLVSSPSGREKIVIIEGDHGYRFFDKKVPRQKEFMNLNAYYFSGGDYALLYDGISPVNTFRVVLNKYFKQSLPMLKDSSVYLINNLAVVP